MRTPTELATTFHDAWLRRDTNVLREILAENVSFHGPFADAEGVEEVVDGLIAMSEMVTNSSVEVTLADDGNAILWTELRTTVAAPTPSATWLTVDSERITGIRTVFDARHVDASKH